MKLLLSIKPEYVEKILAKDKLFEFRKRLPRSKVHTIIIYATSPVQRVLGEVKVIKTIAMSPSSLWKYTEGSAGIALKDFEKYFEGCETAFAYQLGELIVFDVPKRLSDYGIHQAPQSFRYIYDE